MNFPIGNMTLSITMAGETQEYALENGSVPNGRPVMNIVSNSHPDAVAGAVAPPMSLQAQTFDTDPKTHLRDIDVRMPHLSKKSELNPSQVSKLTITISSSLKPLPPPESLTFGSVSKFETGSIESLADGGHILIR